MRPLRQYFADGGTLDGLTEKYGIRLVEHPVLPVVLLVRDPEKSPALDSVVIDSFGVVVEKGTNRIVCRPIGETLTARDDAVLRSTLEPYAADVLDVSVKEDSKVVSFWWYDGIWRTSTPDEFGCETPAGGIYSWDTILLSACRINVFGFPKDKTYVFEVCSPHIPGNTSYSRHIVFLSGVVDVAAGEESPRSQTSEFADNSGAYEPHVCEFVGRDIAGQIRLYVDRRALAEPNFQGVVIRLPDGVRVHVPPSRRIDFIVEDEETESNDGGEEDIVSHDVSRIETASPEHVIGKPLSVESSAEENDVHE